jgi:hypothetical protein
MLPYGLMSVSRVGRGVAVVLLAAALTIGLTYPLAFKLDRVGRLNTGDGHFSLWNVSWVAHALTTAPRTLFDANIFYPHPDTLAYSESNILPGLIGSPVYLATQNPYATHNIVVLLAFLCGFLTSYALARYLTGNTGAAIVCGIAFAYCPYVFARMAHIQLLMTFGLPLALLMLHRLVDRPTLGRGAGLAAALIVQALSCAYYGIFAGLMVGLGVIYYSISRGLWRSGRYWAVVTLAATLTIGLLLPFFSPYLTMQEDFGFVRTLNEARTWSANWPAWIASSSWAHRWLLPYLDHSWNEVLFPGVLTMLLGLAGIWIGLRDKPVSRAPRPAALPAQMLPAALRAQTDSPLAVSLPRGQGEREPTRETTIFYTMLGAIAFWASFGPQAGLYTVLYHLVPVFSFLRAPGRFGVIVALSLSVLMAIAVRDLLAKRPPRTRTIAATVIACALVAELTVAPLVLIEAGPLDPGYRLLSTLPRGPLVEMPFFHLRPDFPRHAEYMLFSTYHWQPLINGYSDHIPLDFRAIARPLSTFPSGESFRLLRERKARYVAFHWNLYDHASQVHTLERIALYHEYLAPLSQTPNMWLFEIKAWPPGTEDVTPVTFTR